MKRWYLLGCLALSLVLGACRPPAAEARAVAPETALPQEFLVYLLDNEVYLLARNEGQRIGVLPPDAGRYTLGPRGLAYCDAQSVRILWLDGGSALVQEWGPREGLGVSSLAWSRDGHGLAYAAAWNELTGGRSIELGAYAGGELQVVTTLVNEAAQAAPDASGFVNMTVLGYDAAAARIVARPVSDEGPGDLWVYAVDTGERVQVAPLPEGALAVTLSPDLSRVAAALAGAVHIAPLGAGAEPLTVVLPADTHAAWLSWSLDGRYLAYLLHEGPRPGLEATRALALELWDTETGQVRRLVTGINTYAALNGWMGGDALLLETYDLERGGLRVSLVSTIDGHATPVELPAGARLLGGWAPWR